MMRRVTLALACAALSCSSPQAGGRRAESARAEGSSSAELPGEAFPSPPSPLPARPRRSAPEPQGKKLTVVERPEILAASVMLLPEAAPRLELRRVLEQWLSAAPPLTNASLKPLPCPPGGICVTTEPARVGGVLQWIERGVEPADETLTRALERARAQIKNDLENPTNIAELILTASNSDPLGTAYFNARALPAWTEELKKLLGASAVCAVVPNARSLPALAMQAETRRALSDAELGPPELSFVRLADDSTPMVAFSVRARSGARDAALLKEIVLGRLKMAGGRKEWGPLSAAAGAERSASADSVVAIVKELRRVSLEDVSPSEQQAALGALRLGRADFGACEGEPETLPKEAALDIVVLGPAGLARTLEAAGLSARTVTVR